MECNLTAFVRIAPTTRGSATQLYIEDVASGEILFQTFLSGEVWKMVQAGKSVTVPAFTTHHPERLGRLVTIETHVVPEAIVESAQRHNRDLAKAAIEWFGRQPAYEDTHEFEVHGNEDGSMHIVARTWDGLEVDDDEENFEDQGVSS